MIFNIGVISIMPDMFSAMKYGVVGRAISSGKAQLSLWNPRDWAHPPHYMVDDKPYGGGPGMVMMYEPLHAAICHGREVLGASCQTIYLSPQGQRVKQSDLVDIVKTRRSLLFVAGRYEGIDERVITQDIDMEWSLGDFVLSGGELATMVYIDAIIRLLPGVLGDPASAVQDSFMSGLLDHPHYTRPAQVDNLAVPSVLLTGNHAKIERYRRQQALGKTWVKRPDLLEKLSLSQLDEQLLTEFKQEYMISASKNHVKRK